MKAQARVPFWPPRDWHREAFDDYTESEFTKTARRAAWAAGIEDTDGLQTAPVATPT